VSLTCCTDSSDNYVEFSDDLVVSRGTEFCVECGRLIPFEEPHYLVRGWYFGEEGEETDISKHTCCEECGDLALSVLSLGYCWSYGDLRDGVREMNEYGWD